ncbi:hypothetical protein F5876DRAFT_90212 [Lentinula aff. lateritia]|uniref:Uncharacterized protein n=1 Tax=Lentinula aff. lateritia TaxID=2804960 RepID=A0ACC1TU76_9AGAR|nr:hypothetical protein F5876DRAFT_90212 [Lentinula aff. lateritia]
MIRRRGGEDGKKDKIFVNKEPVKQRKNGYSPILCKYVSEVFRKSNSDIRPLPDLSSPYLMIPMHPSSDSPSTRPSQFSNLCDKFLNTCGEFQLSILLPALDLGLDLPKDFFLGYHEANENQLRLLHYPGAPASVFETYKDDFGTGTLLFQDDCGGLEVETPSQPGVFMHVPPVPGTVLFNIGDFLMRWSNDTLKSTLHRVRAPPRRNGQGDDGTTKERFSMAYFMGAEKEKTIECLPGCTGPDRPKKYEPIKAGPYINMQLNATY